MSRTGRSRTGRTGRRKIVFLLHNAYAIGGTVRTTLNLAAALADHHDVEIVSMRRHRAEPRFTIDPRITVVPLVDEQDGSADLTDPEYTLPATDFPNSDKRYEQYTRLTDRRAAAYLTGSDADVIIGTRPGINVYVSLFAPRRALRIAQEHLRHDQHTKRLRSVLARHYRRLDAVVTTTEADAEVYRRRMNLPGVRVAAVPNIVPAPEGIVRDTTTKVVAAAGRLVPGKRFDLLIEAFSAVASKEPDWRLRIYGGGAQRDHLQDLVTGLGLSEHVRLMGPRTPIEAEFAKSAMVVSASDAESFGMTLVEAMRCGVPVISTDCPLGPAEIITDGVDGRLVPVGDSRALAEAMLDLITDEPLRLAMGEAALAGSHRYDAEPIVGRYEALLTDLGSTRGRRAWTRTRARAASWTRRQSRKLRRTLPGAHAPDPRTTGP
ncbi:glycosyl transferase [Streptomyces dioscori]|uniref:D-inositol 3-phosphate glycosyltransferase n=1 Tax=Streptomyces dioscori TaxID=2109333 RepID=A0A2P8PXZ8_9ACTN|nr:glycosyltransferase family 4 protein [Streptomyces dioscori]PSM38886.1 glycosyl transferase [Streptomyces dioscori]